MIPGLPRPIICLVTDRNRLADAGEPGLLRLIRHAAVGGVNLIQIRERDLSGSDLLALTRSVIAAVHGTSTKVVVNDRTDVALAAGADGVHLRADSPTADRVRAIVPPGFLIGRSVHSEAEAIAEAGTGLDYLILGTIFPTGSKPQETSWLGLEGLERAARAVTVPLLAIGGVTADKGADIAAAGAAGVAAIGLFTDLERKATDEALASSIRALVDDLRAAFRGGTAAR